MTTRYHSFRPAAQRLLLLLLALLLALSLSAERKKVGLVLGGGGAKGAAHLGVLKVLEEIDMPIDYIAGTSIGAIVGAFYATGHSATEIDSLMNTLQWSYLLSNQTPQSSLFYRSKMQEWRYALSLPLERDVKIPAGVISGQNILNMFSDCLLPWHGVTSFDSLPIPFACVATDMTAGRSVVLRSGSLPLAIRSSMSIPGVFEPVLLDSMVLVDGGVLNNLPTNVVKAMGADVTIGIDLSTHAPTNAGLQTFSGMLAQLIDIMGNDMYAKNLADLDICLHPYIGKYGTMSFSREAMDSLYQRGIEVARAHLPELLALKAEIYNGDTTNIQPYRGRQTALFSDRDSVRVARIAFDSIPAPDASWVKHKIDLREGSWVTVSDINRAIATIEGLDLFSSVTYTVSPDDPATLTFHMKEKSLSRVNIGFRFDTEDMASILLNATLSEKFLRGTEIAATVKLDKNPYLTLEYKWKPGIMNRLGVDYSIGYHNFNLYRRSHRIDNIYYLWQTAHLKYIGSFKRLRLEGGLEWNYYGYSNELYDTSYKPFPITPGSYYSYFLNLSGTTFDNAYYPRRGWMGSMTAKCTTTNFINCHGSSPVGSVRVNFSTALSLTDRLTLIPRVAGRGVWGDAIPPILLNYMGGDLDGRYVEQQIAFLGIPNIQVFDDILTVGSLAARYQIKKKNYIYAIGSIAKSAPSIGRYFDGANVWAAGGKYSYDSAIGPISVELAYCNWTHKMAFYANLGFYF
jgi:NTE family protein